MLFKHIFFSVALACTPILSTPIFAQSKTADVWMTVSTSCPSAPKQEKSAVSGALGAVIIPSLLESAIKGFGAVLTEAGSEKATQFQTTDGEYFFAGSADVEDLSVEATLHRNSKAGCLTLVVGDRTGKNLQNEYTSNAFFQRKVLPEGFQSPVTLYSYLETKFGVDQAPYAYLELELVAGGDLSEGAAGRFWTLRPVAAWVGKKRNNNDAPLVLNIDFSRPLTGAEKSSVAIWTYDLSRLHNDGYAWVGTSESRPVASVFTQPNLALPALSKTETALIDGFKAATGAQQTAKKTKSATAAAGKRVAEFDAVNLPAETMALQVGTNARYVKAELAARSAEATDAKTAAGLRAQADYLKTVVIPDEIKLAALSAKRAKAASTARDFAADALSDTIAQRKSLMDRMATGMMFLNVTATATFTDKANEFLLALGKALSEKSDDLVAVAINELDLDNSVEIQAIQDEAAAKTETLTSISTFHVAQAAALLADATAQQKLLAETAFINAKASCRVLDIKGISLSECADLPASAL